MIETRIDDVEQTDHSIMSAAPDFVYTLCPIREGLTMYDLRFQHPQSAGPLPEHLPYAGYIESRFQGWRLSLRREVPARCLRQVIAAPEAPPELRTASRYELMRRGRL